MCVLQTLVAFDFQSMEKILFVTNILQNIFFCVQRKKVSRRSETTWGWVNVTWFEFWGELSLEVKYIWVAFYFINIKIPAITITLLKPFKNPAYRRRDA